MRCAAPRRAVPSRAAAAHLCGQTPLDDEASRSRAEPSQAQPIPEDTFTPQGRLISIIAPSKTPLGQRREARSEIGRCPEKNISPDRTAE